MKHGSEKEEPPRRGGTGSRGQKDSRTTPKHSAGPRRPQGGVSVYDGQRALGVVARSGTSYTAPTPAGRILGSYRTQAVACDALQRWSER